MFEMNATAIKASIVLRLIFGLTLNTIQLICGQLLMISISSESVIFGKISVFSTPFPQFISIEFNFDSFDNQFIALSVILLLSTVIDKCLSCLSD
jgi:hypothetical protein